VVVGRSQTRAVATAGEISAQTGNPDVYPVAVEDLAVRSEVARLARLLLERYPRIHLLVNNAGAYYHRRGLTSEGIERTFALNVLSPLLLTHLLLPRLLDSAPSRVVMVSSAAHHGHSIDFGDLQGDRRYRGMRAYGRSKLALILLTREIAHRLDRMPVSVNAVHPGLVASGFGRNNPGAVGRLYGVLTHTLGRRASSAGEDIVYVGTDPGLEAVTGEYLSHRQVVHGSPQSRDMVAALRLYEACVQLCAPFW